MLAEPIGERPFVHIAGCKPQHGCRRLDFVGCEIETAKTKKNISRQKRRPLVSVEKGVVPYDPRGVSRREDAKTRPRRTRADFLVAPKPIPAIRRLEFPPRRRARRVERRESPR
jgi:hypothetical protein